MNFPKPSNTGEEAHKKAWMAGSKSGIEIAFEMVFRSLEGLMENLGIKRPDLNASKHPKAITAKDKKTPPPRTKSDKRPSRKTKRFGSKKGMVARK